MVIKNIWALGLLFLFTSTATSALEIQASVSDNPAIINESLDLIVTVDDSVEQNAFDFSVLNKDFRVLGTSVSSETRMINFKTTRITRFTTRLMPKKTGQLIIPSFEYQTNKSEPIRLEVVAANNTSTAQKSDIFVETKLSNDTVWLQQQVTFHCKLYIRRQISSGSLSEPEIPGAIVEVAGKDKESTQIKDGVRYRVIERTYLITPQRSGTFEIESPVFQAEVIDTRRSQFFNQSKVISRTGESQSLTVKPVPKDYQGTWLPSAMVMLNDEIQPDKTTYTLGEPITRKITLSALDVNPEQLPELSPNYPDSIKVYPDQSESNSNQRDGQVIAQRIQTAALVPTQAGEFELPEIRISWFNTKLNKQSFAIIPAQKIVVEGNKQATQIPSALGGQASESDNNSSTCDCNAINKNASDGASTPPQIAPSDWAFNKLSLLLLSAWLISVLGLIGYIYTNRRRNHSTPAQTPTTEDDEKKQWQHLIRALKDNNKTQIYQSLPTWVAALHNLKATPDFAGAVKMLNDEGVESSIANLQSNLYSKEQVTWDPQTLLNHLKRVRDRIIIQQKQQLKSEFSTLNP